MIEPNSWQKKGYFLRYMGDIRKIHLTALVTESIFYDSSWYRGLPATLYLHFNNLLCTVSASKAKMIKTICGWICSTNYLFDNGCKWIHERFIVYGLYGCRGSPYNLNTSAEIERKTSYRKISNIRRTKSQNVNVSRLGLQLSLRNIFKPSAKWRTKM